MFLKSITLHGFKSFADPTQLDLKPGVTTVVGPNGCGKSNIMDAIRWVLGEQSAKALRGGKMQDVIFAGTETRKALPFCEVKLVFTDCERELGTQFHEVEIVRRVTRDEGSDYFINGKVCRLKDIQTLFMDTGVGQVSYSFLVQGQVDQILSSNPMERRAIFEEAAGITKYKSQRKEALNKLSLTEVNLTRITDIIDEVSKRMGVLKRQASKALRWKRHRHRMEHLDRAWNARQYLDLTTESGSYRARLADAESAMATLKASVVSQYKLSTQIKAERADMYRALEEKRAQLYALRARRQQILSQCDLRRSRVEHLEARIQQIDGELRLLREQEEGLREGHSDPSAQLELKRQAVAAALDRCAVHEKQVTDIDREGQTKARLLQELKQQLVAAENQVNQTRASSTRLEVGIETYHAKHESLLQSFHQYEAEWKGISRRSAELEAMLASKTEEREQSSASLAALRNRLATLEAELQQTRVAFSGLEKQYTQLAAEFSVLDGLQKRLEGFGEGAKAMLEGKMAPMVEPRDLDVLAKGLQVDAALQKFCEVVLGALAEAIVYRKVERIPDVADALDRNGMGRACLLIPGLGCAPELPDTVPDQLVRADTLIRSTDPVVSGHLELLLGGVYFCESIRDALQVVSGNPGLSFEMIVTRKGEMLTPKGVLYAGSSGNPASGILKRQQEIRRIADEKSRLEAVLKSRAEDLETALSRVDTAKDELEEQREIHALVERELSNLKTEISANERACKAADERRLNDSRMLAALDKEKEQALESLVASRSGLERAESRIT
ncbi:MAG: AAA family ATPase, partial [Opitutales bacterium]|nr:AAA family ATPase [Opitutales bacterium]